MKQIEEKLKDFMKGKDKVHLTELYSAFEASPASIRATLNLSLKKGKGVFERLGEGNYRLVAGGIEH